MKDVYYIYRHIRKDSNEVFYIGKGTKSVNSKAFRNRYKRAHSHHLRSEWWKKIVNKCGYDIEIMFEHSNEEFIFEKEIEFIELYGRRDMGMGSLVNFTDGGEGLSGYRVSKSIIQEYKEKYSQILNDIIVEWDYNTLGIINRNKIKKHTSSISEPTINKYWFQFDEYVDELNRDYIKELELNNEQRIKELSNSIIIENNNQQIIKDIIDNWDFNTLGKITQKKVSNITDKISINTIGRNWKPFKKYIKKLNKLNS